MVKSNRIEQGQGRCRKKKKNEPKTVRSIFLVHYKWQWFFSFWKSIFSFSQSKCWNYTETVSSTPNQFAAVFVTGNKNFMSIVFVSGREFPFPVTQSFYPHSFPFDLSDLIRFYPSSILPNSFLLLSYQSQFHFLPHLTVFCPRPVLTPMRFLTRLSLIYLGFWIIK